MQLALWREACRHIDVAESVADLAGAVGAFVPIDAMWVFALREGRCALVAAWGGERPTRARFSVEGAGADSVERFVRKGGVALLNAGRPGRSLLTPLAPVFGDARVVCGALLRRDQPEGLVAWRLGVGADLDDAASVLLAGALEPLAVALDTSGRFHELESLRRAAEADRQSALVRLGRQSLDETIIGAQSGLRSVMERVDIVAPSDVPVLILGETGSGKEVVARALHERSPRRDGPFLRVNCGAIAPELIDSQLFGHEKGAFTGATDLRHGWFERADTGTLFLDEIGELSPAAQVRLLRVMQEGVLERVGGQEPVHVDVRVIAATHRDLAEMVQSRQFREDLWYRLAVFPLVIPPLRERGEDLRALSQHFADRASTRFGLEPFEITDDDVALLAQYDWPGNIRELAAVIDRAALLGGGHRLAIGVAMGSANRAAPRVSIAPNADDPDAVTTLDAAVRTHVEHALRATRGKIEGPGGAAALLAVNPQTLRSKMRKLGLDWRRFRS